MKVKYEVSLTLPEGVSLGEMKDYIEEAVAVWCKGMCPDDPIFDLDEKVHKIKVRRIK